MKNFSSLILTTAAGLLSCSTLASALSAQRSYVLPAGEDYERKSGASGELAPFTGAYQRMVQVFDKNAVGFARGSIEAIAWRRNARGTDYAASARSVVIRLGYTTTSPARIPSRLSRIATGPMTAVFSGRVELPFAPRRPGVSPWSIVVKLRSPWYYDASKGNFVLEVESSASTGTSWLVDAHFIRKEGRPGKARELGPACRNSGPWGMLSVPRLETTTPGQELRVALLGGAPSMTTAFCFLGLRNDAPFPIDLSPIGARGCRLYTEPSAMKAVALRFVHHFGSVGEVGWPTPRDPSLAYQKLNVQWLAPDSLHALGFSFSNGTEVTLGDPVLPWKTRGIAVTTKGQLDAIVPPYESGSIVRLIVR